MSRMTMRKAMVAGAVALGAASGAWAQSTLTTLFAGGNGGAAGGAIYFDLVVGGSPITITSLDTNTVLAGAFGFTMYTKPGTFSGSEANAAAWTVQTTGVGTGAGVGLPSPVVFNSQVVLAAGQTWGVALVLASSGQPSAANTYTNGTGANQTYSTADMTLNAGSALNVPFTGTPFTPRVWNGTLHYTVGGVTGACCKPDGQCVVTTSANCTALSGLYRGDNSPCATAACPQPPTGACCLDTGCSVLTQANCTAQSGTYRGDNVACGAAAACPAPTAWAEQGDAANLPATAQTVTGTGSVLRIRGTIAASGESDMYKIQICDAANFSAITVGGSSMDTQLFLFNANGIGVVSDDDDPQSAVLQSRLTAAFVAGAGNGVYYLAISTYNNDPRDASNNLIWLNTPFNVERAPDGLGAANAITAWDNGAGVSGPYTIFLTGVCFIPPPCPADYDHNGLVEPADVALLVSTWFTSLQNGTLAGDFDGNGVVEPADVAAFVTVWFLALSNPC